MSSSQEYLGAFQESAATVGLIPDEANMLWRICNDLNQYSGYKLLRARSTDLAVNHEHVDFDPARGRAIDDRAIGVTAIRGSGSATAYLQGPEHASELVGSETVATATQLLAHFPEILNRWGYGMVQTCDHIDPVGQAMQAWGPRPPADIEEFALGGWRGSWPDYHQISWAYPTASGQIIRPEIELSLELLREARHFFGSAHGSTLNSYIVMSRRNKELARLMNTVMNNSGLVLNRDDPEVANTRVYAPGIFATVSKKHLEVNLAAAVDGEEARTNEAGTSALDHLERGALMLVPEVACLESATSDMLTPYARQHAIEMRANMMIQAAQQVRTAINRLDSWIGQTPNMETQLLYKAINWYGGSAPGWAMQHVETGAKHKYAERILTRAEYAQALGAFAIEALLFTGNAYRLAQMAGDTDLQQMLRNQIRRGAIIIGPTRAVPLSQQVATQTLAMLGGLRHAARR